MPNLLRLALRAHLTREWQEKLREEERATVEAESQSVNGNPGSAKKKRGGKKGRK